MKTLKNILLINALSSGVTGIGLAVVPNIFAELFDATVAAPFVGTGLFLIAFAALVFSESRKKEVNANRIRLIILLDALWVIASLSIIVSSAFAISSLGYFMIGAVALWVALMAYLQFTGLKKALIVQ